MKKLQIRIFKKDRKKTRSQLRINKRIIGDSIERMLERIREGEGEDSISDRDLVYNDNESNSVNPITNIRSDKFELMLEEKIGEQDHRKKRQQKITEDIEKTIKEENEKQNKKEEIKEAKGQEGD